MTNEQFDELEPGDVVKLNSGGAPMTVVETTPAYGEVETVWMAPGSSEIKKDCFPQELLIEGESDLLNF